MLGYTESDLNKMINAVHDSKLFYLRTPSDLMDKTELRTDLEMAGDKFIQDEFNKFYELKEGDEDYFEQV